MTGCLQRAFRRCGAVALTVALAGSAAADDAKITYEQHVRPIFAANCLSCHNPDKTRGGLDLSTFESAMAGGSGGAVLAAGDSGGSALFGVVSHTREPKMPPRKSRLPDADLDTIRAWIDQGCLKSADSKPIAKRTSLAVSFSEIQTGRPAEPPPLPLGMPLSTIIHAERTPTAVAIASHPWSPVVAIAGQQQVLVFDVARQDLIGALPFDPGRPQSLSFSRSGALLVAGGGIGGQSGFVRVWTSADGSKVADIGEEFDAVLTADVDPTHRFIALGGPSRVVKIHSLDDGSLLHKIEKHTEWITALAYSPDGILLATADRNGGLFVWEAESVAPFHTLGGHSASITSMSWRGDGNVLATCSEDGQIRLW